MPRPIHTALLAAVAVLVAAGWYLAQRGETADTGDASSDAALAAQAMVAVTLPESLSARERQGAGLFAANCSGCHGVSAAGSDNGPPLVHRIYEPGHHADESFLQAAERGARAHHWQFGDMPPVEGVSRAEVGVIVSYVRALQRANGIR